MGLYDDERLAALVMRCIEKEPARRPQSCGELLDELDEIEREASWSRHQARVGWERHMASHDTRPVDSTRVLKA